MACTTTLPCFIQCTHTIYIYVTHTDNLLQVIKIHGYLYIKVVFVTDTVQFLKPDCVVNKAQ